MAPPGLAFGEPECRVTKASRQSSFVPTGAPATYVLQLLLGHTKIESTVRYLGIEVDDALATAEQVDV
jgi:hypothetical protein